MRWYFKQTRRAALAVFRRGTDRDYDRLDALDEHNLEIARRLYAGLMAGTINHAYVRNGGRMDVYTRSLRGDFVQVSHFAEIGGDWVALSHCDAQDAEKLLDESRRGVYVNIVTDRTEGTRCKAKSA